MKVPSCIVILLLLACLPLVSCSTGAPSPTAVPITLQYTAASYPWLVSIYDCAGNTVILAEQTAADIQDLQAADIAIRLGQLENLPSPAYQIGTDDLLVIVNPQNPIKLLTVAQVRSLFNGQIQNWKDVGGIDAPVQVWAFTKTEDIQGIFNHLILSDSPVTSMARLASNPNEITQAISKDINAIGILNRRLITSGVSDVFTVTSMPVLAFTRSNPTEGISNILSCLQK
jgi:ABC-type phosphate transport system substrate-binding protein